MKPRKNRWLQFSIIQKGNVKRFLLFLVFRFRKRNLDLCKANTDVQSQHQLEAVQYEFIISFFNSSFL